MIPIHYNNNSSSDIDDIVCQLSLMCEQEERWYSKVDSIYREKNHQKLKQISSSSSLSSLSYHHKEIDIDEHSRFQMMTWCYDVANFCNLNHSTVEISMNYIDRFMMTSAGYDVLYDRSLYQLVCMTSFYTIAKANELKCIDLPLLRSLSRDLYTEKQFESMESVMLNAVNWHINSPTTELYIDLLLKMIPTSIIPICRHEHIHKRAIEQAEYLLLESKMISTKSSVIAYCSLISVIEDMNSMNDIVSTQLALAVNIDSDTDEIRLIFRYFDGSMKTFRSSPSSIQVSIEQQEDEEYECYPKQEKIRISSLSSTTKNVTSTCLSPQDVSLNVE